MSGSLVIPEVWEEDPNFEGGFLDMKCLPRVCGCLCCLTSKIATGRGEYKELFEKMAANIGFMQRDYEKI